MSQPMDYLARYRAALKPFDLNALRTVARDMMTMEALILPHPDHPSVVTTCRSGQIQGLRNVLFFADSQGKHRWCLVQSMNFLQVAITEAGVRTISGQKDSYEVRNATELFQSGAFDPQFDRSDTFGGAILSSSRPFHFFYDHLLHLTDLSKMLPGRPNLAAENCFSDPVGFGDWNIQPSCPNHYYLLPNVAGAFLLKSNLGAAAFEEYAAAMERQVEAAAPTVPQVFSPEATVLWIGITGQKRSWLEQVEGYAAIINAVAEVSPGVGVFIDGMTAPSGERLSVPEDESVASAICDRLHPEVLVTSLIGLDYATKIGHCRHVDAFIANGGTGCIVPLRFSRKPGVVHSNSDLRFFEGGSYSNVAFVDDRCVLIDRRGAAAAKTSYHIAWQHIHNLLADVLRKEGRPTPDPLPEPDVASLVTSQSTRA